MKALADQGSEAGRTTPGDFSAFIDSEHSRWKELAEESCVRGVSGPL
jgi:hypothetical protein